MSKTVLSPMKEGDLGVIGNYLVEEAKSNGVLIYPTHFTNGLKSILKENQGLVIEKDGLIVASIIWEDSKKDVWLTVFFIAKKYRTHRDVLLPMLEFIVDNFKGRLVRYKALHKNTHTIPHCKKGIVNLKKLSKRIDNMKGK